MHLKEINQNHNHGHNDSHDNLSTNGPYYFLEISLYCGLSNLIMTVIDFWQKFPVWSLRVKLGKSRCQACKTKVHKLGILLYIYEHFRFMSKDEKMNKELILHNSLRWSLVYKEVYLCRYQGVESMLSKLLNLSDKVTDERPRYREWMMDERLRND